MTGVVGCCRCRRRPEILHRLRSEKAWRGAKGRGFDSPHLHHLYNDKSPGQRLARASAGLARTQIGHERTRVHACPLGASRPRSVTKVIPHALQDHDTDLIGRCRRAMVTAASAERRRATSPADLPAPPLPRSRDRPVLRGRCCRTPTGPWPRARSGTSGRPARTRRSGRDRAVRTPRVLARVTIEARCGGNSRRGQRPHASPSTNPRAIHHALARSGRYRSAALTRRNSGRSGRTE